MRHQDLTINHILESWTFANAAARNAAGAYVSGDIGRIGYQSDTGEYYRLLSATPTWALIAIPSTATFQTATQQTPTATASTAGTMAGLGSAAWGSASITPVRSGKVFVSIQGTLSNSSTGSAVIAMRYGTSAAPANGAAATGAPIGAAQIRGPLGANFGAPYALTAIISGLTLGQAIWVDLVVQLVGAGTANIASTTVSAFELP